MKSSAVAAGDAALATQYNNLRQDAQGAATLLATQQSSPNMTLLVQSGTIYFGTTQVNYAGGNSPTFVAPVSNPRIDLLYINSAGTLTVLQGTEAASPSAPTTPNGALPICHVYLRTGTTALYDTDQTTNGYIYRDLRPFVVLGSNDTTIAFTAHENITAGNPVGVSNGIDNAIARAVRTLTKAAHSVSTPLYGGGGVTPTLACEIGGDKFVYVGYTAATSDTLYAQVGQVTTGTKTLTLGTAANIATAFNPVDANLFPVAVCKLDTDKFIVFYIEDASTTVIKYRVGTVSGTTITYGTAATLTTAASSVALSGYFSADFISTDKFVFAYKCGTATNSRVLVGTVSGTTATAGTAVALGTNTDDNNITIVRKIGTDKFVVVCHNTSNSLYGQVGTCSGGTTITLGTELQLSTSTSAPSNSDQFDVASPATDVFVVMFSQDASNNNYVACTVATRTITAGTTLTGISTAGRSSLFAFSSTVLYTHHSTDPFNYDKLSLSGTTLTRTLVASRFMNHTSENFITGKGIAMANGDFIIVDFSNIISSTNISCWVFGMSNNFIGIAQATVSKGATVSVLVRGIDANQSALQAGSWYKVDNGALSAVSDSTNPNSTYLGISTYVQAISATQVKV